MNDGIWNAAKVIAGLFAGTPLLAAIQNMNPLVISIIQCVFFTIFYTVLDHVKKKVKAKWEEDKTSQCGQQNKTSQQISR